MGKQQQLLDFKSFKKVHEDENVAVLSHDKGHEIKIAKASLSPALRSQLAKLPLHQAGGSDNKLVSPDLPPDADTEGNYSLMEGQTSPPDAPNQTLMSNPNPEKNVFSFLRGQTTEEMLPNSSPVPDAQGQQTTVPEVPAPDPYGLKEHPVGSGFPEALKATEQSADAQGQQARESAAAYNTAEEEANKHQALADKAFAEKQAEMKALSDDLSTAKIDPSHYLHSQGVGSRIATAIGLILGGISSGQTGQPNPALQFLNKQIDNDVEAQKAGMVNKHNLLSALSHQYNSLQAGEQMYRATMAQHLANQLGAAAAKAGTAQAKMQGQMGVNALLQQRDQMLRQATLAGLKSEAESPAGGPSMPEDLDTKAQTYLKAAEVLDPKGAADFRSRYIPSVGVAKTPLVPADRALLQKKTELNGLLQRAQEYMDKNKGFGAGYLGANRAEGSSLQNQIQLKMGELADLTRFTPEENKLYSQSTPDLTGTHFTGKDQARLKSLQDTNNISLNTFYQQKGLQRVAGDTDKVTVLSPNGQSGKIPKSQLQQALKAGFKPVQ